MWPGGPATAGSVHNRWPGHRCRSTLAGVQSYCWWRPQSLRIHRKPGASRSLQRTNETTSRYTNKRVNEHANRGAREHKTSKHIGKIKNGADKSQRVQPEKQIKANECSPTDSIMDGSSRAGSRTGQTSQKDHLLLPRKAVHAKSACPNLRQVHGGQRVSKTRLV